MAPAWALTVGSAHGRPPVPASTGLVQWAASDVGLTIAPATRAAALADQSGHAQDWQQNGANPGNAPFVLGDTIDGIPLITFGTAGIANKSFNTAANFKDRFGVDMDGAHARTSFVVVKPLFDGAFNRMGGPLWNANSWWSYFFFDPTGIVGPVNGAYAWTDTGGGYGVANQFTPQDGSALGPYNGVPFLVAHFSAGRPDLEFRINNTITVLAPLTMHGAAGPASAAQMSDGGLAFMGGFTENLVYDYDLRTAPAELAQTLTYLRSRYPSIPIV
jgi:hypothetical protein